MKNQPEEDRFDALLDAMLTKPGPDEVLEAEEDADDEEA